MKTDGDDEGYRDADWPTVRLYDWCGEFEDAEPAAEPDTIRDSRPPTP